MEADTDHADRRKAGSGPNYLALALKVFAVIVAFNIVATLVFYFFIAPHMMLHH